MSGFSSIKRVAVPPRRQLSEGLSILHVHPESLGWDLDPVLQVDWFRMSQPYFRPHPHAGFSAVTYMLPESAGGFVNRDSRGDRSVISPGALHWTEAGRGMLHEEVPAEPGTACDGLQIFVNLPAAERLAEPRVYHVEPADVPAMHVGTSVVRVLVGDCAGTGAAVRPRTTAVLWDVFVPSGAALDLPLDPAWVVSGLLRTGELLWRDGQACAGAAVRFAAGDVLRLVAGDGDVRVAVLGGRPLGEAVVARGPFVMTTPQQLVEAEQRFRSGGMGQLSPSF